MASIMSVQQATQLPIHLQTNVHADKVAPVKCQPIECATGESSSQETLVDVATNSFERSFGDTELSYFLPSRESGVNDMWADPSRLLSRDDSDLFS